MKFVKIPLIIRNAKYLWGGKIYIYTDVYNTLVNKIIRFKQYREAQNKGNSLLQPLSSKFTMRTFLVIRFRKITPFETYFLSS